MDKIQLPPENGAPTASRVVIAAAQARRYTALVPIREIGPRHRERIAQHTLALDENDRYLRFGYAATDDQIRRYVDGIDFSRDNLFGIFNRRLDLIAVAHLAYPPDMVHSGFAEFGVSVAKHARGRGYGARLFERASIHAVNGGVKTLYVHALTENAAMLRIARKAGARVEREGSEAEARLALPVASLRTRLSEMLTERVARMDHWIKREAAMARNALAMAQEIREGVREARHKSGS